MEFIVFLIKEFKEELRRKLQDNFTRIYDTGQSSYVPYPPPPKLPEGGKLKGEQETLKSHVSSHLADRQLRGKKASEKGFKKPKEPEKAPLGAGQHQ